MTKKNKISCVVPIYNEGSRAGKVLKILSNHPLVDELIVVNDGSTDNSEEVIKKFKKIRLISHHPNRGKSYAVMKGIEKSKNNIIMLIDADLIGLTSRDISSLIKPVLSGEADVSMSLRGNAPLISRWLGIDFISGERIMKKSLIKDYKKLVYYPLFGIETGYLNPRIIKNKARLKIVKWDNVKSPYPSEKIGFVKGNIRLLSMMWQIVKITGLFGVPKQFMQMKYLTV